MIKEGSKTESNLNIRDWVTINHWVKIALLYFLHQQVIIVSLESRLKEFSFHNKIIQNEDKIEIKETFDVQLFQAMAVFWQAI